MKTVVELYDLLLTEVRAAGSRIRNVRQSSVVSTIFAATAAVLAQGYQSLLNLQRSFYISTATGTDLDLRVNDLGMSRNPGSLATGFAYVTLPATEQGIAITAGTVLVTPQGVYFKTMQSATVATGGSAAIPIVSLEPSYASNVAAGTSLLQVNGAFKQATIQVGEGLVNGFVFRDTEGGVPPESDEALRARFPDYIQSLAKGTFAAVKQAIKQALGNVQHVILDTDPAAGYISIYVAPDTNGFISSAILDALANALKENGPAGMGYLVFPLTRENVLIDVTVVVSDLSLSPLLIKTKVQDAIVQAFNALEPGTAILRSHIVAACMSQTGVYDVRVNSPTRDLIAAEYTILNLQAAPTVAVEYKDA
jgi:uncharacterized phage protein gp47/JayE